MKRVVDPVFVDDDGRDQSTKPDQRVPFAAVAGKPRGPDHEYRAGGSGADRFRKSAE